MRRRTRAIKARRGLCPYCSNDKYKPNVYVFEDGGLRYICDRCNRQFNYPTMTTKKR